MVSRSRAGALVDRLDPRTVTSEADSERCGYDEVTTRRVANADPTTGPRAGFRLRTRVRGSCVFRLERGRAHPFANAAFERDDLAEADRHYQSAEVLTVDPGLVAFNRATVLFHRAQTGNPELYAEAARQYYLALSDSSCPADRAARLVQPRHVSAATTRCNDFALSIGHRMSGTLPRLDCDRCSAPGQRIVQPQACEAPMERGSQEGEEGRQPQPRSPAGRPPQRATAGQSIGFRPADRRAGVWRRQCRQ